MNFPTLEVAGLVGPFVLSAFVLHITFICSSYMFSRNFVNLNVMDCFEKCRQSCKMQLQLQFQL